MEIHILCPVCGQRLFDAESREVSEVTHVEAASCGRHYDYRLKCTKCKKIIGFTKVSQKHIA